jgi:hypothetical protein
MIGRDLDRLAARAAQVRAQLTGPPATLLEPDDLRDLSALRIAIGAPALVAADHATDLERERRATGRSARAATPRAWFCWCKMCGWRVSGTHAVCPQCREHGPHVWGEESPAPSPSARRRRLAREQRARKDLRR